MRAGEPQPAHAWVQSATLQAEASLYQMQVNGMQSHGSHGPAVPSPPVAPRRMTLGM
jgi:hypothetical protein